MMAVTKEALSAFLTAKGINHVAHEVQGCVFFTVGNDALSAVMVRDRNILITMGGTLTNKTARKTMRAVLDFMDIESKETV